MSRSEKRRRGRKPGLGTLLRGGLLLALGPVVLWPADASGQEIPPERYLRFLPLEHRKLQSATGASERFHLFGDRSDPAYRDRSPRDGIDDRRALRLRALTRRFAPLLVRNTDVAPVDFRVFTGDPLPLQVDRWRIDRPGGTLVSRDTAWMRLGRPGGGEGARVDAPGEGERPLAAPARPAPYGAPGHSLLELLRRHGPDAPRGRRPGVDPAEGRLFEVLFVDLPGGRPTEWERRYEERLAEFDGDPFRTYAHPFLRELANPDDAGTETERRYELVLQYWFFYPYNDGGNDHEGDWEHLNVVVAGGDPLSTALTGRQVRGILGAREARQVPLESLVVGRVDYYFHGKVMTLDYLRPNVYRPRAEWRAEKRALEADRLGRSWILDRIRERAYRSRAERRINSRPVAFIGGNNKGLDQLLAPPGGANKSSHGTYPFPGLYKDVGPAGASEGIGGGPSPHHALYEAEGDPDEEPPSEIVRFDRDGRIRLLPDWERLHSLAREERSVREAWAWFLLPMRWGYPAVRSPFAGVVPHAETGNEAPYGPAFNPGWNRVGVTRKQAPYDPHRFPGTLPLGWKDGFLNSWGWMNLTLPTLSIVPPFDFAWRVLLAPVRAPFQAKRPTFFPGEAVPFRLVGGGVTASVALLPDDFTLLLGEPAIFDQIQSFIDRTDPETVIEGEDVDPTVGVGGRIEFHIGNRLVSVNEIRHLETDLGFDLRQPNLGRTVPVRAELDLWEYVGSLRYNVSTGSFQPFLKLGYGLSWFRVRDVTLGAGRLDPDRIDFLRQPSFFPPENLLPNTFNAGVGFELVPIRRFGRFPDGLDLGLRSSFNLFAHGLGLEEPEEGLTDQRSATVVRPQFDFGLSVTF